MAAHQDAEQGSETDATSTVTDMLRRPCPDCGSTDEGHATPCGRRHNILALRRTGLPERAERAAAGIFERRLDAASIRRHGELVRSLMAEAYAAGYVAGLRAAHERVREEPDMARTTLVELLAMARADFEWMLGERP